MPDQTGANYCINISQTIWPVDCVTDVKPTAYALLEPAKQRPALSFDVHRSRERCIHNGCFIGICSNESVVNRYMKRGDQQTLPIY